MNDLALDRREAAPPPLPDDAAPFAIHPLFPLPEGVCETKEIHAISFDRWDHQGRKERCPDRFLASDLTSLAQVIDMFGGGTYQFFAFDRRGNYSRWTAEKDKVRVNLPCKPFRPIEAAAAPSAPATAPAKAPAGASGALIALLLATQERTDRMILALLDHLARVRAAPAPPPPPRQSVPAAPAPPLPVQAVDPMAMMLSLATLLEKLRPPSESMDEHLRALAMIVENMGRVATAPSVTASAPLVTAPAPPARATPPAMVWAEIPGVGPALMRQDQAQMLAQFRSPPPSPSVGSAPAPVTDARPGASSSDDIVLRLLKNPAEQLAFKDALERTTACSSSPVHAAPAAVLAPVPGRTVLPVRAAPAPVPVRAAPPAPVAVPAPPRPVTPPLATPVPAHAPVPSRSTPPAPISAAASIPARPTPPSGPETPHPPRAPQPAPLTPSAPVTTLQQADAASPRRRARSRSRHGTAGSGPDRVLYRSWLWWRAGPQTPSDAH